MTFSPANETPEERARTLAVRPSIFPFLHCVMPASDYEPPSLFTINRSVPCCG
jgi:hypothetical protein